MFSELKESTIFPKHEYTLWKYHVHAFSAILYPKCWTTKETKPTYRIVSNKRPGGVAIFQKGDVYKRQVFNAKMQCLSLFTMIHRREI